MSTALAPVDTGKFLALRSGGDIAEALAANSSTGESFADLLTRVKVPSGGSTMWVIPKVSGDVTTGALTGVLAGYVLRGVIWPLDEPQEGSQPAFVTHDLKYGEAKGGATPSLLELAEPYQLSDGRYDWAKMTGDEPAPWGWGTAKTGKGKKAKEQRVLFLLTEYDPFPVMLTVGPGSLKNVRKFMSDLGKEGIPHYRAVVKLTLQKTTSSGGQPFSRVFFSLDGILTPEDGKAVKAGFTDQLHAAAKAMEADDSADDE